VQCLSSNPVASAPANIIPGDTMPMNLPIATCSKISLSLAAAFCSVVKCGMVFMPRICTISVDTSSHSTKDS